MNDAIKIQKLHQHNLPSIIEWCKDKDEDFLRQWAGIGYSHPLTVEQINDRLNNGANIFEALRGGEIVGTIEIIDTNEQENTALIGRFVINPKLTGCGVGSAIMTEFLRYCKEELKLTAVNLFVFDFNKSALKCYQKCGFTEIGQVERSNGWIAIHMQRIL